MRNRTAADLIKARLFAATLIKQEDERFKGVIPPKAILQGVAVTMRTWADSNVGDTGLADAFCSVAGNVDRMLEWPEAPYMLDRAIDALCEEALALDKPPP